MDVCFAQSVPCIAFAVIIKMEMVLVCNKEKKKDLWILSVLENAFQPIHLRESNALGNLDCSPSALWAAHLFIGQEGDWSI